MALKIVSGLDATSLSLSSFLDLQKNELRNAQIHNLTTTQIAGVGTPASGQFAYDTTLNKLKVYNGTAWELVGASADGTTLELSSNTLSIKAAGVDTTQLAAGAVTTAKIDAAAVTGAKMAALTIATGNIANLAVTSGKLAEGAVGTAKLAADAVTSAKIADGQVDTEHLATDAVTAAKIADNSIDVARLNASDGTAGQFLKTNGSGTLSFATPVDDSVSGTNLTATLAALDTTHTNNVHGSGATAIVIGSSTNTPNVQVTGDVIVDGDLMVSGTTTTVNSTTISVADPVFTLGGTSAPSADDNKDRGIEFHYYDSSAARKGFFGYDDSAREFTALVDITNNDEVFSGTLAPVKFGTGNFTSVVLPAGGLDYAGTAVTATGTELNILDGVTASTAELNKTDGLTASTAELNIMDGVTATTTELNYVDGVTSAIQTQINSKQATITGAATTIDDTNLTASRVVVSNASGKIAASAVTSSELGVLDGITASTAELNKMDGVTVNTATINDIVNRAKRYVHTETNHGGGELQIAGNTHNLTAPYHISVIDSSGAMLLAEIVQNQSTGLISIQDLPAETIKVHITGGE
jgi:hypothetical protein